jgi:hypothetical protein
MAQLSGTNSTYDAKGIREQLADWISNIAPVQTPFMSNIGRGDADNTYFEWQTDTLDAVNTSNAHIEGDNIGNTTDAVTNTVRLGNRTQISRVSGRVSRTSRSVSTAGRADDLMYHKAKKAKVLKRDQEAILLANQAAVAGDDSTARTTGSLLAFLKTNTSAAADGTDPTYTTVPSDTRSDGAVRSFTETLLKNVNQSVWSEGGEADILMVGPFNKGVVSGFSGIAEIRATQPTSARSQGTIIGGADVYISDFGPITVVPNRFQRERDALLIDPSMAKLMYLDPLVVDDLAKTGDSDAFLMVSEYGLCVNNEKAHGIIADVATTY